MKYLSSEAVSLDVPITILDCERALASADCRQSAPKSTNPDKYECVVWLTASFQICHHFVIGLSARGLLNFLSSGCDWAKVGAIK